MDDLKERGIWLVGAEGGGDGRLLGIRLHAAHRRSSSARRARVFVPSSGENATRVLSIPMRGKVNSLNVASAASVFLFEVVRQRVTRRRHPERSEGIAFGQKRLLRRKAPRNDNLAKAIPSMQRLAHSRVVRSQGSSQ